MLKGSVDNSQCNRQRTPTKEIKSSSGFCSGYLFKFFSSIRTDQTLVVIHKGFVICIKEGRTQKKQEQKSSFYSETAGLISDLIVLRLYSGT